MNTSENTLDPSDSNHAVAKKIFDRMVAFRSPDERPVDADTLAAHVAYMSGKSYGGWNIRRELQAAGCLELGKHSGRTPSRWRYCDVLPILQSFKKGRADAVEWPPRVDELRGEKKLNKKSSKNANRDETLKKRNR